MFPTQNDRQNAWKYESSMDGCLSERKRKYGASEAKLEASRKWIKTGYYTGYWEGENEDQV